MFRSRISQICFALRPVLASNTALQTAHQELNRTISSLVRSSLPSCSTSLFSRSPTRFSRNSNYSTDESSDEEKGGTSFNVQDFEDFEERVLNSDVPVVVDFHADWCGPCKMLGPRLEAIVDDKEGRVLLAKVNIDDCGELAIDYGVTAVPTVLAFKDGMKQEDYIVGDKEDELIQAFVDELVEE